MVRVLVALAVMFVGGGGGAIYAADAAVPGDLLYGLDRAVESLQLRLSTSSEVAAGLLNSFASERLQEADQLAAAGDAENAAAAMTAYDNAMLDLSAHLTAAAIGQEEPEPTETSTTEPSATPAPSETATTEPSATPTPTETATVEPPATPEPAGTRVGADPHPVGGRRAEESGEPDEDVRGLC